MIIDSKKAESLIEDHLQSELNRQTYEVIKQCPVDLLTWNRLDLAFKLLFLEMKYHDFVFPEEVYKEHIRAFSFNSFTEPGNDSKNSFKEYLREFKTIYKKITEDGFNFKESLIPLSNDGSIVNGAHRVASAIYLKKDIYSISLEVPSHIYDYKFFHDRNVNTKILDAVVTKFIEYASNTYIAIVWPNASNHILQAEKYFKNVVYRKKIQLNANGAHNLVTQIYYGEDWLGNVQSNFEGAKNKAAKCFGSSSNIEIIVFQSKNLDETIAIKDNVRSLFDYGKHSIHITDTKLEASRAARILLNDNSVHFLNYARPNKIRSAHQKLEQFKEYLSKNNINKDDVSLDSGIVLSLYGIRETTDIDYLNLQKDFDIKYSQEDIDHHESEIKYHKKNIPELLLNPQNYFYFDDLKFISFNQILLMKKQRNQFKDTNDVKVMNSIKDRRSLKSIYARLRQNLFYKKLRLQENYGKLILILRRHKTYLFIRDTYRNLRKK